MDLERLLESHRRELTGYCYRMLAAGSEAEDAVQETMLRAWRSMESFEGRSSVRSWLYRIAHNVCIDMHRSPQRRARPMELGPSVAVASATADPNIILAESSWIMPIADERVIDLHGDPAAVSEARESIRLAFVAALQHLPPRQRSILILFDVLDWDASEIANLLDTSTAAVNSALQRARGTLASHRGQQLDSLLDEEHTSLLTRYMDAFERYDIDALVKLLRDDAILTMPPFNMWLEGPEDIVGWWLGQGIGCKDSRMIPISVNGTGGFGSYRPTAPGRWEPFAIQVVEAAGGKIIAQHNFLFPEKFADFGLPPSLQG